MEDGPGARSPCDEERVVRECVPRLQRERVCVCVCVCKCEREREIEGGGERERRGSKRYVGVSFIAGTAYVVLVNVPWGVLVLVHPPGVCF